MEVPRTNVRIAVKMDIFTRKNVSLKLFRLCSPLQKCLLSNISIVLVLFYCPSLLFAQGQRYEFQKPLMGSPFKLVFYAPTDSIANRAAEHAFKRIEQLDNSMSDYKDGSEINELSATSGTNTWLKVSPELFDIINKSKAISSKTGGNFDITIGPAVQLWRRAMRRNTFPEKAELDALAGKIGYRRIRLNTRGKKVKLTQSGMRLDLGGIGKGYAADEALKVLRSHKISSAFVDAGGDLALADAPPGTNGWKIAINSGTSQDSASTVELANVGIATSGANFRFLEHDGKTYSHIVNPKTGVGLTTHIRTTVIAPNGTLADALATAFSVAGIKEGKKLLKKFPGTKVWLLETTNGKATSWKVLK
jgi:thiamine biosynthesis lipoprotein